MIRKTLLLNIENFQNMLIRNQEKLENFNKNGYGSSTTNNNNKEASFNTSITSNGTGKRYY